jgi:HNH endonuclease
MDLDVLSRRDIEQRRNCEAEFRWRVGAAIGHGVGLEAAEQVKQERHVAAEVSLSELPAPPRMTTRLRRLAREADAPGNCSAEQRAARWAYYGGRCWMCGKPASCMDHVKPLVCGGSNWPSNQRPSCWPCNALKAARWPFVPPKAA